MIFRVTESMKYGSLTNSLSNIQVKSTSLMEKISTQKNINRPSDDPVGARKILNYNSTLASIDQYQTNITNAQTWLSLTDTNLEAIKDIIAEAESAAMGATDDTMNANAAILSSLIDEALSIMNAKHGDSYIFGGSRTDVAPFSLNSTNTIIGTTAGTASNTFKGTVTSDGTYTAAENNTYAIKIVDGGALYAATYQVSTDGGKTWGIEQYLPPKMVEGSKANTVSGTAITATTAWNAIDGAGVVSNDTITISGKTHDGTSISGTYTVTNASTGTVQDLLDEIENTFAAFGSTVTASINTAGKIIVTDGVSGDSQMEITLVGNNESGGNLDFGTIDTKTTTSITLGDGISMTFDDLGTQIFATNDLFTVNASVEPGIGAASAATANAFNGKVTSDGTYTGTENKTYAVKVIAGGALGTATCRLSSDGGKTWSDPPVIIPDSSGSLALGDDGVTMKFDDSAATQKNLAAGDLFTVNAYAAGYYRGNDNDLTVQIGKNNNFVYNITGSDAFTAANGPTATAAINPSASLPVEDTITLTRGDSAGSWTITSHNQYPNMVITSISDTQITIDADNDTTPDITLTLSDGKWQKGNTVSFTIMEGGTPLSPVLSSVEVKGPGTVDLLRTLKALKAALEAHDENVVAVQIDDLENIQTQVLQAQTKAGAKASYLELSAANLTVLNERITSMKSNIEDADLDKLIVSYQMEQVALEASYNLAAQIGKMTIMDYLR